MNSTRVRSWRQCMSARWAAEGADHDGRLKTV